MRCFPGLDSGVSSERSVKSFESTDEDVPGFEMVKLPVVPNEGGGSECAVRCLNAELLGLGSDLST